MSKRLGFTRRFINKQPNYRVQSDGISTGGFGTVESYKYISHNRPNLLTDYSGYDGYDGRNERERFIPLHRQVSPRNYESFDLVNQTFPNKVYVCVDKGSKKYAIAYNAKDESTTSPVIVKPVNLHDKSEWITSDAGAGILNFFYSLKSFIHIDVNYDESKGGIIPVMRSDIWQNAFFEFGTDGSIILKSSKDGVKYCLAFKKAALSYSNDLPTVSELADKWNKEYRYFDASSVSKWNSDGNPIDAAEESNDDNNENKYEEEEQKESFISKAWKWVKESFTERMDVDVDADEEEEENDEKLTAPNIVKPQIEGLNDVCYLELVKYDNIDGNVYSYQWEFQEVWDIRTATNIALETKQIEDLKEIDKIALQNKEQAYNQMKAKYEAEKAYWDQEKAVYDSHFMTKFY